MVESPPFRALAAGPAERNGAVPPNPQDLPTLAIGQALESSQATGPPGAPLRRFGDYELLEMIARGGMGAVYKARQIGLNRIVAVKMILAGELASAEEIARFQTEAQAAANLQHNNIVKIYGVGEHEGQHYFAMEYVDGKNLLQLLRETSISPKQAARYRATDCTSHRIRPPARRPASRHQTVQRADRRLGPGAGDGFRTGQVGRGRSRPDGQPANPGDRLLHVAGAGGGQTGPSRPGQRCLLARRHVLRDS